MRIAFDPTGKNILFVGAQGFDGFYSGLYLIGVDGSNPLTLVEPLGLDAQGAELGLYWSPEGNEDRICPPGTRVSAGEDWVGAPRSGTTCASTSRVGADGTGDVVVSHKDGAGWEAPHGMVSRRSVESSSSAAIGETYGAIIVDIDGNSPPVVPAFRSLDDWYAAWSPDGSMILTTPEAVAGNGQQQLWDARTSDEQPVPWTAASYPSWQRVAP